MSASIATCKSLQRGEIMIGHVIKLAEESPECLTQSVDHALNPRDVIVRATDEWEKTLRGVLTQQTHSWDVQTDKTQKKRCFVLLTTVQKTLSSILLKVNPVYFGLCCTCKYVSCLGSILTPSYNNAASCRSEYFQ